MLFVINKLHYCRFDLKKCGNYEKIVNAIRAETNIVMTSCTNATSCFRANVTDAKLVCFYIVNLYIIVITMKYMILNYIRFYRII